MSEKLEQECQNTASKSVDTFGGGEEGRFK